MARSALSFLAPTREQSKAIQLRVLSLGAGVQSTTLALMAAHGEIAPMPDCAIFADTGWEPQAVYDHLAWLASPNVLPFPIHIVSAGSLRANLLAGANGKRWVSVPAFTRGLDADGSAIVPMGRTGIGMIRRQCTTDFKIVPIRRKMRALLGIVGRRSPKSIIAEQWIGISFDEVVRMKPSADRWVFNRWPLIEKAMSRRDCLRWLEKNGYPRPPRSSCIGCPYHSDAHWRAMRDHDAAAWADAVTVDRAVRTGFRGLRGEVYLHRSAVPLDQADLSTAAERGQRDLWPNECEGICGV